MTDAPPDQAAPADPPSEHLAVTGLEEWSSLCSTAYVPLRVSAHQEFHGALRALDLGPLSLSQVGATPSTVQRTTRLATADPREALLFSVFLRGTSVIAQHGRADQVVAGGAYLLESDQPYSIRLLTRNDILILRLPAERVGLGPRTLREIAGRPMPPGTGEVEGIARATGFSEVNTFIRAFRRRTGQTPGDWRRQHAASARAPAATARAERAERAERTERGSGLLSDLRRWGEPADAPFLEPPGYEKRSTPASRP